MKYWVEQRSEIPFSQSESSNSQMMLPPIYREENNPFV